MYEIKYTKQSVKDISKIKIAKLDLKTKHLIEIIKNNPYQNPPEYEKLTGNLKGSYSRRINRKHRLIYEVYEKEKTVKIISMWTHYENV